VRWQVLRTWTVGSAASYTIFKNVIPVSSPASQGGHTVSGSFSTQHQIGEHFSAEIGYSRIHQSYGSVAAVAENPDGDHEYISITYQFARPLGR
jgi:hypothetical protein